MLRRMILPLVLGASLVAAPVAAATTRPLTLKQGRRAIAAVFDQELAYASGPVHHAHLSHCHRTGRLTVVCGSFADVDDGAAVLGCYKYYRAHRGRRISVVESQTGKAPWRRYVHTRCKV